ncbi:MAG TPA: DUF1643 domain-containing protein [Rhodopila sp.]|nr:DUF1643 domain-containing protein [Rhodopila sp.]
MNDLLLRRDATLSGCGKYRYRLSRHWDDGRPEVTFIMLNPSTADALVDDATIRKCMGFARRWDFGGIYVGNLFGFRATKPADMLRAPDPVGPDNRDHLEWMCERAAKNGGRVICAWGANGTYMNQDETLLGWLDALVIAAECLRLTPKSGAPEHPLYVPYETAPRPYQGRLRRAE